GRPGEAAGRLGGAVAGLPGGRLRCHGAAGRGAGVPGLPDAAADLGGLRGVSLGQFTWLSFLASSAAFGALHGRWLAGTLAGMLYALAVYRRGQLADAVLAHATTNALLAAYVLATGSWGLWA